MLGTQDMTKHLSVLLRHIHQTQTHLIPEYPKPVPLNVETICNFQETETRRSRRHLKEMDVLSILKIVQLN